MGLALEDLLRMFVCSETVDAVECHGCQQQPNTDESASTVRTTFIKRLTLGKVTEFCIQVIAALDVSIITVTQLFVPNSLLTDKRESQ